MSQVLPELYALTPIEEYPARALSVVRRVVGADKGVFTEVSARSGDFRVLVDPEPPQLAGLGRAREAYTHEHPVMAHFLSGSTAAARLISDFLTRREFHGLALYGEFFAPLGVEDQLTVLVASLASGRGAAVSIDRGGRSFDDYDRRLMDSLRPHLTAARSNAIQFSAALSGQSRSGEASGQLNLDRLTDRQREILAQLSCGCTNAQIALALDISVGTVRKHVEHILRRLDLPTRTAAAVSHIRESAATDGSRWTASIAALLGDHVETAASPARRSENPSPDGGGRGGHGRAVSQGARDR